MEFNPNLVAMILEFDIPKGDLTQYNKIMSKVAKKFAEGK
jgi:hypothetical protein